MDFYFHTPTGILSSAFLPFAKLQFKWFSNFDGRRNRHPFPSSVRMRLLTFAVSMATTPAPALLSVAASVMAPVLFSTTHQIAKNMSEVMVNKRSNMLSNS